MYPTFSSNGAPLSQQNGSSRRSIWSARLVVGCAFLSFALPGLAESEILYAWKAGLTGNLKLQDEKEAATIHFWNKAEDTITWKWTAAAPGTYLAELRYSFPADFPGGRISLTVGGQRTVAPAEPSESWADYRAFPLGVVSVDKAGEHTVVLQAAQMPSKASSPMPDVAWLSLTPADTPATSESALPPSDFKGEALFDGTTLDGWEGNPRYFRVEEGAIVAGDLKEAIPSNQFLATTREYGDFELRFQARVWKGRANGGVQFRSQREKDSSEMTGYQADCTPGLWGGVYDESRRGAFLGVRLNAEKTVEVVKTDDWNQCVIRCEGPRIRLWVNDVLTLDFMETDESIPRSGFIGLQIHGGAPAEVAYKDIRIQELAAPKQ